MTIDRQRPGSLISLGDIDSLVYRLTLGMVDLGSKPPGYRHAALLHWWKLSLDLGPANRSGYRTMAYGT
eukprot:2140525-Amphidinium_carterae.1